ncbi:MAG: type II toxin-antitoxin system VapC family toxin [Arcicella sp.]|jgi:tRNA(fMet)-specific endonuclease VapC|nr:type II toxin-antitoxin system VapC family toxin [Arcicella sp.]
MNIIFDTNIILGIVRSNKTNELLEFLNPENKQIFSSVITEAEIRSIAIQNKWGKEKLDKLEIFLDLFTFTEVTKQLITTYVEIDTFSQRKNPNFPTYNFDTPRNMGKNDLWIASTATLLGLELVSTDADFAHLHNVFLDVRQINIDDLKQYF